MRYALILGLLAVVTPAAPAQGRVKAARELAEFLVTKFGSKVGSVGGLTTRLETLAVRHGEGAVLALRKGGPGAVELVEKAGANGGAALRCLTNHGIQAEVRVLARPAAFQQFLRHGDQAAVALVRHPGIAEPLIERGGANAVKALAQVEAQSGRRLAMLAEGELSKHPEMMGVAATHGERAVKFMWENKVALAGTAAAAAFIADPEPFLNGTSQLVTAAGEAVVKPVVDGAVKPAVQEAGHVVSTFLWVVTVGGVMLLGLVVFLAVRHPKLLAAAAKLSVGVVKLARTR